MSSTCWAWTGVVRLAPKLILNGGVDPDSEDGEATYGVLVFENLGTWWSADRNKKEKRR
ncbi:MAG: hypothetical protein JSV56_00775 [Methanomassiliicoccales archaeon]|nr:MAG: hypothetical protein JSV56_00775 [Methanomassiliicoccales archaeon]